MSFDVEGVPPPPLRNGEGRGGQTPARTQQHDHQISSYGQFNRQVAWYPVWLFAERMAKRFELEDFPGIGTPAWDALPDDSPEKLCAAFYAAALWSLRIDTLQEQLAAAARAISAAEDWTAIAKANRGRAEFAAANPWAKRVVDGGSGTAKLATDAEIDAENTTENTTENSTLAEGTIDFGAANPWAKRVRTA
jgi:hypothetical protein